MEQYDAQEAVDALTSGLVSTEGMREVALGVLRLRLQRKDDEIALLQSQLDASRGAVEKLQEAVKNPKLLDLPEVEWHGNGKVLA